MLKPRKLKVRTRNPPRLKVQIKQDKLKIKIRLGGQVVLQNDWEIPESYPDLIKFWMTNGVE